MFRSKLLSCVPSVCLGQGVMKDGFIECFFGSGCYERCVSECLICLQEVSVPDHFSSLQGFK